MKRNYFFGTFTVLFCIMSLVTAQNVIGETQGITKTTVKIGSNMILTGPAAFWGQGSDKGARAYFNHINEQGGINGRKIEFINTDNEWKPVRAVASIKKLIERDKIFVLTGVQGSACIMAAEQVFTEAGIPLIAPVTTGKQLAYPPRKMLFVAFTQYEDLAPPLVDYMATKEKWKNAKFAAIYQNDIFGKDGADGLKKQVEKIDSIEYVAGEYFERGATDFSSQVLKCKNSGADVLLISTAVAQAAMIIKECEKLAWKPQFIVLSGAADEKLIELVGSISEGLLASTNVIMPTEKDNLVVQKVTKIIHKYYPDQAINVPAVDGVAVAMITVEAIKRSGSEPTQAKVIDALESMKNFETGILPPLTFGPNDRQGCKGVFLYQVQKGKFTSIK